jgi:hypothetical protein
MKAFQQQQHDPNKITKATEEEWDQLDLWLASYAQNNDQKLLLKKSVYLFGNGAGLVWSR